MGNLRRKEARHELKKLSRLGITGRYTGPWTYLWRYGTGAHLDGEYRTDATWWRPGHWALVDEQVYSWSYWPRTVRAFVRWALPPFLIAPALSGVRLHHVAETASSKTFHLPYPGFDVHGVLASYEGLGVFAGCVAAAVMGWRAAHEALTHRHAQDWVLPVHEGLAEVMKLPAGNVPRRYLRIVQGYQHTAGDVVRVELPRDFLGETGKAELVEHVMRTRLDLYDPRFLWQNKGRKRSLTVSHGARDVVVQTETFEAADERMQALWEALAPLAGLPVSDEPRKWLAIDGPLDAPKPEDAEGASLRLELPTAWVGERKTEIKVAIEEKLDIDLTASFKAAGARPYAVFKRAPEPPRMVRLSEIREQLLALPEGTVGLGLNAKRKLTVHNHFADAPHLVFSGETGAGKSVFAGVHSAQVYMRGAAHCLFLDPKYGDSLPHATGYEGFTVYAEIHKMWHGLEWGYETLLERMEIPREEFEASPLPPIYIYIDELNMFYQQSKTYWSQVKEKGDKETPPVNIWIETIAFQGRSRRVFLVFISHLFQALFYGSAVQGQFGGRGFSSFNLKMWQAIMSGPKPRTPSLPGRGVFAVRDEWEMIQWIYGTGDEFRALLDMRTADVAEAGPESVPCGWVARAPQRRLRGLLGTQEAQYPGELDEAGYPLADAGRPVLRVVRNLVDEEEEIEEVQDEVLVTLAEAVDMDLITISKNTAQKYAKPSDAKYDPTFPKPAANRGQAYLYNARELEEWESSRQASKTGDNG